MTTSDTLATLQTVNPQRIAFAVPERYASRLGRGQRVVFRVASLSGTGILRARWISWIPVVQLPARTILVKALVPNGRRQLQAGMFVEVRLATEVRPKAVVVPEDAIVPLQRALLRLGRHRRQSQPAPGGDRSALTGFRRDQERRSGR